MDHRSVGLGRRHPLSSGVAVGQPPIVWISRTVIATGVVSATVPDGSTQIVRLTQLQVDRLLIGMVATPTFLLVSGAMVGLLCATPRSVCARGVF